MRAKMDRMILSASKNRLQILLFSSRKTMTIYHQILGDSFSSNFSLPTQRYRHFVRGS